MSLRAIGRFFFVFLFSVFLVSTVSSQPTLQGKEGPTDDIPIHVSLDTISACPGIIWVPLNVDNNALNLASISLVFSFNTTVLTYLGYDTVHKYPGLNSGFFLVGNVPVSQVNLAWWSVTPFSINHDTLVSFKFQYNGGVTPLTFDWVASEFSVLNGDTIWTIYHDGEVNSENHTTVINQNPQSLNVCEGSNAYITLNAFNVVSYVWQVSTDGGVTWANVPNAAPYTGVTDDTLRITDVPISLNNHKYRCVLTDVCPTVVNTTAATLLVQAAPVVNVGVDTAICQGQTYALNATATNYGSFTWSSSGSGNFTGANTLTPVYTPSPADISAGSVTVTLTAEGFSPCGSYIDDMLLTIHPLPDAFAGNDTIICQGGTATLHASGGTNFEWNTTPPQYTPVISLSPAATTSYTVTVSNMGCTDTDQVLVTVINKPAVNAGTDDSICSGETYTLSGTSQNTSAIQWTTSGDGSFSSITSLTPLYTPGPIDISNGSAFLILSGLPNAPCAVPARDTMVLTIIPLPTANAGSNVSICNGKSTTLTATGGTSFIWNTTPPQTTASITVSPQVTTVYTVTVANQQCAAEANVEVTVMDLPAITLTNDTMICYGHQVTLSVSGGLSYLWSNAQTTSTITVQPITNTVYGITVTGLNTCQTLDSVVVMVNANLTCAITPANPFICEGESIALTASSNHPCTYVWSPATGLSTTIGPVVIASPTQTTKYTITATDGSECTSVAEVNLVVYQNPPVEAHPPLIDICRGDTITLTAYGALSYYWSPPTGLTSNNLPVVQASPNSSIIYELTGTDIHNCKTTVTSVVNVFPVPLVTLQDEIIVCRGENYLLDGNGHMDSCTYYWQDGSTHPYLYVSEPGVYYVTVDRLGCSVTDTIEVKPCSELFVPNAFSPNNDGTNDFFYIVNTGDVTEFSILIYSRWGEVVYQSTNINEVWDGTYDGKKCPVGVYHYVIEYLGQGNVLLEKEGKKHGQITLFR